MRQGLLVPLPAGCPIQDESLPDIVLFVAKTFERTGGHTLIEAWRIVERHLRRPG